MAKIGLGNVTGANSGVVPRDSVAREFLGWSVRVLLGHFHGVMVEENGEPVGSLGRMGVVVKSDWEN